MKKKQKMQAGELGRADLYAGEWGAMGSSKGRHGMEGAKICQGCSGDAANTAEGVSIEVP